MIEKTQQQPDQEVLLTPIVLFENESILVINKPSGLIVHRGVKTTRTLTDWIAEKYPELQEVGEPYTDKEGTTFPRPGIVHRLDQETSGVMVIAKTQRMFKKLKKQFQQGKIKKEYHAFVYGTPKRLRGIIQLPIGRSRKDFRMKSTHNPRGKTRDAYTEYAVAMQCGIDVSLVRFYPKTGRTHQIRVHAKSIQHPVLCDRTYAPRRGPFLSFTRMALHAYRITFTIEDDQHTFIAPYPKDFLYAVSQCQTINCDATGSVV